MAIQTHRHHHHHRKIQLPIYSAQSKPDLFMAAELRAKIGKYKQAEKLCNLLLQSAYILGCYLACDASLHIFLSLPKYSFDNSSLVVRRSRCVCRRQNESRAFETFDSGNAIQF